MWKRLITSALLLGTSTLTVAACSGPCKKCDEAIQHMAGKIVQFGCDPSIMEDAQQRIVDDCEEAKVNTNHVIGAMVESCQASGTPVSSCEAPLASVEIPVSLSNNLTAADGIDNVGFTVTLDGKVVDEITVMQGQEAALTYVVNEGDEMDVTATDLATGDPLALSEKLIVSIKASPGAWTPYLKRRVALTGGGTFDLTEQNW